MSRERKARRGGPGILEIRGRRDFQGEIQCRKASKVIKELTESWLVEHSVNMYKI